MKLQVVWGRALRLWLVVDEAGHVLFQNAAKPVAEAWAKAHQCIGGCS